MLILGLHDGHNATAALLADGRILAMSSEERFTYRKNEFGFPTEAIRSCLRIAGVEGRDVDRVAFSTTYLPLHYMRVKRECLFTIRDYIDEQELYWKPLLFEGRLNAKYFDDLAKVERLRTPQAYSFEGIPPWVPDAEGRPILDRLRKETLLRLFGIPTDRVAVFDHHDCHAAYGYFGSPFRDGRTLVFDVDGGGDGANATLGLAEAGRVQPLGRNNHTDLGRIYRYVTLLLGMRIGEHEYKVMGLAPYASDYEVRKCDRAFKDVFHVPDLMIEYKNRPRDLYFHFRELLADCRFDGIAGGVQQMVEEVACEWVRRVTTRLGVRRVIFTGGVSMNVKMNKAIAELESVDEFYCPPSGGDESIALGAAYLAHTRTSATPVDSIEDNFLGPRCERAEIEAGLVGLGDCEIRRGVTSAEIAELLARDLVIARLAGRMEFGARALGNRSILANPSSQQIVRKINRQIKFRDFWMPFAPSILEAWADRYLVNPKRLASDHMTMSFETTAEGRIALAAAIHPADFTARAHLVRKRLNPAYHELIEAFAARTGIGAVLNTSFNLHGYPIVCTIEQAIHVFRNSDLDAMVLEDVLVLRRR